MSIDFLDTDGMVVVVIRFSCRRERFARSAPAWNGASTLLVCNKRPDHVLLSVTFRCTILFSPPEHSNVTPWE